MSAVAQRSSVPRPAVALQPAPLSLREAVSQVSDSSRNLLGLIALSNAAQRDLNSGSPETTLDGVISKAVLRSLLGALHYRDLATLRHSRRVALLAVGLAHHLGWEGRHLRVLEVASLLHDVGKIGAPDNILYKPGKLSAEELELMDLNHGIGLNVLQACRVDPEVLRIVDQSHRAYNLKDSGEGKIREVHIGARILAVADAYESLCTEQVYRIAKPHQEIMNILMAESGKQFDGNVVSSLARWVQQDGLPFAAQTVEPHENGSRRVPLSLEEAAEAMALCQIFSYLYMLESIYDGFHVVDADGRFVVWNRGVEKLVGRSASTMLGKEWTPEIFGGPAQTSETGTHGRATSTFEKAIRCGKSHVSQIPFLDGDSTAIELEMQTVPLIDADGRLHGVAEIFRNLSLRSQLPDIKQWKQLATQDALTSVANRGELERQLKLLAEQYRQDPNETFSVIFADADHFKRVNDTFGHQVGDQVLVDLAKHFCDETYSGEIVGRYGGEEFVILCPETNLEHAVRRANRLRTSLQVAKIGGADRLKITCSFGVSQIEPEDTTETLLNRADRALYVAKESGRDRTCSFTSAELLATENRSRPEKEANKPFEFSGSFSAVTGANMVVHKLGGFVKEHNAEIVDVDRERVVLRLRGVGMFKLFRQTPDRQGLEIELLMEGASRATGQQKIGINVKMTPYGGYRNERFFNERARSVMKVLKEYFVSD